MVAATTRSPSCTASRRKSWPSRGGSACRPPRRRRHGVVSEPSTPRIAHFVCGLRPEPEPMHLVHYLAIASCLEVVQPSEVHVHCHHVPLGPYWELLAPRVVL